MRPVKNGARERRDEPVGFRASRRGCCYFLTGGFSPNSIAPRTAAGTEIEMPDRAACVFRIGWTWNRTPGGRGGEGSYHHTPGPLKITSDGENENCATIASRRGEAAKLAATHNEPLQFSVYRSFYVCGLYETLRYSLRAVIGSA